MQTDHPTVELFFVFAFTYCKLRVYKKQEVFARRILEAHEVEFLTSKDSKSWQELDTRVLLDLVADTLPKMISSILPQPNEVANKMATALGIGQ